VERPAPGPEPGKNLMEPDVTTEEAVPESPAGAELRLSVVIPTYNRRDILPRCLTALANQTIRKTDFEIVIVDDGSTDDTPQLVESLRHDLGLSITYLRQNNKGPAAARNAGIRHARGKVVWITGDDYLAEPTCLEEHLHWQENLYPGEETAVLGYATWPPYLEVSDLMYWVEHGGPQFYFEEIDHEDEISFYHFITCNVSFKRSFFEKHGPFDERFPYAMGEDTDLGIKFALNGLRFYHNRNAVTYHDHPITEEQNKKRIKVLGEMQVLQEEIWPKLHYFKSYQLEPHRRLLYWLVYTFDSIFRPVIRLLPQSIRRIFLFNLYSVQQFDLMHQGIKSGLEKEFLRGKTKPAGEVILVFSDDKKDLNAFYKHIDKIKRDFGGLPLVVAGPNEFRSRVKLAHPAVDWLLLCPGPIDPIKTPASFKADIKALNCRKAVLIDSGTEFELGTAMVLKSCGIPQIFVYNQRGDKILLDGGEWKRGLLTVRPNLQTLIWGTLDLMYRWIVLILETLMVPVNGVRVLITLLFYRNDSAGQTGADVKEPSVSRVEQTPNRE
jgi:glycosyltransferase involved in cell wall biosynthesis